MRTILPILISSCSSCLTGPTLHTRPTFFTAGGRHLLLITRRFVVIVNPATDRTPGRP